MINTNLLPAVENPRNRDADVQRRARLDELAEARHQLDEELALLRQELGVDAEPPDRWPA
jgi:hypothetical protein